MQPYRRGCRKVVGHLDTGAKDDLTGEQILNDNTTAVEKMILFTVENHIKFLIGSLGCVGHLEAPRCFQPCRYRVRLGLFRKVRPTMKNSINNYTACTLSAE